MIELNIPVLLALVAVTISGLAIFPLAGYLKKRSEILKIPGPPSRSILFGALDLPKERHEHFNYQLQLASKYWEKGFYSRMAGPLPTIVAIGPEIVKETLGSPKNIVKPGIHAFENLAGHGLFSATGQKWKEMRHILTPSFHFQVLLRYLDSMNQQSDIMIQRIKKQAESGAPFDIFPIACNCALDIIAETAMGIKLNAQTSDQGLSYVHDINAATEAANARITYPWLLNDFIFSFTSLAKNEKEAVARIHAFGMKVINERKKLIQEKGNLTQEQGETKERLAFLDLLLATERDGKPLTDQEIREEVDTFMLAGHETTSHSTAWTIQLLGLHPKIQEQLQNEIDEVMGDEAEVTAEMLGKFHLLDRVIKESLRLYPAAPRIGREIVEDVTVQGSTIPKGTGIFFDIVAIHRNPLHWENPDKFDPDRWLPENSEGRHPYSFVPFAAGPRNCIGQKFAGNEEKILLAKILKNFKVESMNPDPRKVMQVVLKPIDGIWIKATPRK